MLPIDPRTRAINTLIEGLAPLLEYEALQGLTPLYDGADLQPTRIAAHLAAVAAVSVIYAHDTGQTVNGAEPIPIKPSAQSAPKALAAPSGAAKSSAAGGPRNHPCPRCKRKFKNIGWLNQHLLKEHAGVTA